MNQVLRKFLFALAVVLAVGASAPFASAQRKAADAFKNIKVLNDLPEDQLLNTMRYYEAALGVGCDFCHTEPRDKDTEIKDTARKMITMVRDINQNTFGGEREVTCMTCHRGRANPVSNVALADEEYEPWEPDSRNGAGNHPPVAGPPPAQILDKWIATLGGADKINQITSRVVKAVATNNRGGRANIEIVHKGENGLLVEGNATIARVGTTGWFRAGNGNARDLRNYESTMSRIYDLFYIAKHVKGLPNLTSRQTEIRGGLAVYQTRGGNPTGSLLRYSFGRDTGHLLRIEALTQTANGRNPIRIDFYDFEEEGDGVYPHRWVIRTPLSYQTVRVESVEDNGTVDDARFARPARR